MTITADAGLVASPCCMQVSDESVLSTVERLDGSCLYRCPACARLTPAEQWAEVIDVHTSQLVELLPVERSGVSVACEGQP